MRAFSADWLALREPADVAARSLRIAQAIASKLDSNRELRVVDFGAGTGSNLRFLVEHLPIRQRWTLVDHDDALLSAAPQQMTSWSTTRGYDVSGLGPDLVIRGTSLDCRVTMRQSDLHKSVDEEALYEDADVVTASALLDLVSDRWLHALVSQCAKHHAVVLFALTYDGRIECSPRDPEDETIRDLVNRHQHTDKGFGAALGPDATAAVRECFTRTGYEVRVDRSDWVLDERSHELQRQLMAGWVDAAIAMTSNRESTIRGWLSRRLAYLDANRSRVVVGHTDLAAWPTIK